MKRSFREFSIYLCGLCGLLLALVLAGGSADAQFDPFGEPVSVESYASLSSVPPGGTIDLAIVLRISPTWHVNAHVVNDEYLIPTTVEIEAPEGLSVVSTVFPDGAEKRLSFSDQPLRLYDGDVHIGVRLRVDAETAPFDTVVTAVVTYQPCDDVKCLAPEHETLRIPIRVSAPTEAIDATHPEIFEKIDFAAVTDQGGATPGGRLGSIVAGRGLFFAFLIVFVWGLALNLTPCVYPLIPITVGYFGGQAGGKSSRTLFLAIVYVLGMAVMYSSLGLFAALTGSLLGTVLQNPFVVGVVALVLVALALSMFGLYEFRIPAALSGFAGTAKQGVIGAFLMGLTVGIVAAPCIGPFVLALLTFVGESGNPALGFSLFFTLSLGLGLPFIFLAVLSGSITRLPRSGEWMDWVKKLFGVILIAMAIFFLQPHIGDVAYFILMAALFIAAGVYLGFVKKMQSRSLVFQAFRRFIGVAAPLFGLYLLFAPGHIIARGEPEGGIDWKSYDAGLVARAKDEGRFVIIDFAAEWCLPCKELDHRTFSQDEVVSATSGMLTVKADLTESTSPEVAELRREYAIKGVPTVVFLDRMGNEREELRVFGFVDKDEFLKRIERLKSGA